MNPSVNPKCEQKPTRRAARLPDKADWTTRGNRQFVIDRLGQVGVCWQRRQRRALPGSIPPLLAQSGCGAKKRQKKASTRHRSCEPGNGCSLARRVCQRGLPAQLASTARPQLVHVDRPLTGRAARLASTACQSGLSALDAPRSSAAQLGSVANCHAHGLEVRSQRGHVAYHLREL